MAQASEVFTQPPGATANVEYAAVRRQRERSGDIGKVAEMPVHVLVHAFALIFRRFVGDVVERLGA